MGNAEGDLEAARGDKRTFLIRHRADHRIAPDRLRAQTSPTVRQSAHRRFADTGRGRVRSHRQVCRPLPVHLRIPSHWYCQRQRTHLHAVPHRHRCETTAAGRRRPVPAAAPSIWRTVSPCPSMGGPRLRATDAGVVLYSDTCCAADRVEFAIDHNQSA